MSDIIVVTTSYPRRRGDAEGHFVSAEVRRLRQEDHDVTVLAPGRERASLWGEQVQGLGGGAAFGFPGALSRLQRDPTQLLGAARFVWRALGWLERAPLPHRVIAHFLLPCGVPIATRGLSRRCPLEVVVHGSDARLFARLPGRALLARELVRAEATLRFVSTELCDLVLGSLPALQRRHLAARSRVQPSPVDLDDVPSAGAARALLGIAPTAKVAVIATRLVASKRVDVALRACARIQGLRTFVLGDGPERERLEREFPAAGFVGHLERPRALAFIAAANVLVSASLEEGAPSVVREARALGTPVVCLQAGDLLRWAESDPGLLVVALQRDASRERPPRRPGLA
jgi:teichuronic acid biosynthesis glycosyltransferase TuaC